MLEIKGWGPPIEKQIIAGRGHGQISGGGWEMKSPPPPLKSNLQGASFASGLSIENTSTQLLVLIYSLTRM